MTPCRAGAHWTTPKQMPHARRGLLPCVGERERGQPDAHQRGLDTAPRPRIQPKERSGRREMSREPTRPKQNSSKTVVSGSLRRRATAVASRYTQSTAAAAVTDSTRSRPRSCSRTGREGRRRGLDALRMPKPSWQSHGLPSTRERFPTGVIGRSGRGRRPGRPWCDTSRHRQESSWEPPRSSQPPARRCTMPEGSGGSFSRWSCRPLGWPRHPVHRVRARLRTQLRRGQVLREP